MPNDVGSMHLVPGSQPALPVAEGGWGNAPTLAPPRSPLDRPMAAMRRYKWLVLVVVALAVGGGYVATRLVIPEYEVRATIWIASETPSQGSGPIRSRELLNATAWVELIKSYRISDAVVKRLALYLKPESKADAPLFRDFTIADKFFGGTYSLKVEKGSAKWRLALDDGPVVDSGAPGDSIGLRRGLRWRPEPAVLSRFAGKDVKFTVSTPRETSVDLIARLGSRLPEKSNFLWLSLHDADPQLAAQTLNTWVNEYVAVAGDMKRKNMVEFANILGGQLQFAEASLHDAETALETFRVRTITQPSEGVPVSAGLAMTNTPALQSFFDKKIEYDNLRHDREALEKVIAGNATGTARFESVLLIPSVVNSPSGEQLKQSFSQLYKKQADLAAVRQVYTDQYPAVRDLINDVNNLETKTIPQQTAGLLAQIRERERDYSGRVARQSSDLESIPVRTIEEMRLRRAVTVAEGLYTTLKSRFAEAKLAEASASPDLNVLDSAIAPLRPTKNTAPRIMGVALMAGLGAAIGLALLLDGVDKRIRYPEQASNDLGLSISGTVPQLQKGGIDRQSPEQISQLVESFRTIRMNVMNSGANAGASNVSFAVSSPSPADGKSFIATNLAMSFADAGFRTLLVDGDTRRGALHEMFGLTRTPGLTDFLARETDEQSIIRTTGHDNLFLIPTGILRRRSPELLTSPALVHLVADLKTRYDVLIFDTPPFAAGVDSYAIAAALGSVLVVLRIGQTERRMAAAKLLLVDRLPINVVGTVLNSAPTEGEYVYYGYALGYGTEALEPGQRVAQVS